MVLTIFILTAVVLSTVTSQGPLDPEEMWFILSRCMEDNLKEGPARVPTLLNWRDWDFEPANDEGTHCFAKCVLEKAGLYNSATKQFNADVIREQSKKYPELVDESSVDVYAGAIQELPNVDNNCSAIFMVYVDVHNYHRMTSKNLFHGNRKQTTKMYQELNGNIRQKGQSYMAFCENKFYSLGSANRKKLCDIWRHKVLKDDNAFKKLIECVMKGFRYITKDNQLNLEEIKRDFSHVGKDTEMLNQVLDTCQVQADNVAEGYYKCLLESEVAEDFKEAFDYREIRSQNYDYNLVKIHAYSIPSDNS